MTDGVTERHAAIVSTDRPSLTLDATDPRLFLEPGLGVVELLLQLRARLGQRCVVRVQLLDLPVQFVVLVAESSLEPGQIVHLPRQLLHLRAQATHLVVVRRRLRLRLRLARTRTRTHASSHCVHLRTEAQRTSACR